MSEQVYCIPTKLLPETSQEPLTLSPELYELLATQGSYLPRDQAETDPTWRQIIPYAVVIQEDKVLLVERLKAGTEARLHNLHSLGIGGHINPVDHVNARDIIEGGLIRELREELELGAFTAEAVALIHCADNEVSLVHTGVLYKVQVVGDVKIRETHKLAGEFLTWTEVAQKYERLEGWSQAAFSFLEERENEKEERKSLTTFPLSS
jgi:predicted NUDIX family phosphoesterase